jgi:hypothetical protein
MPNAHEGYISWEKAEAIRRMASDNVPTSRHHGAAKHGMRFWQQVSSVADAEDTSLGWATQVCSIIYPATTAAAAGWITVSHAASPLASLESHRQMGLVASVIDVFDLQVFMKLSAWALW